MLTAKDYAQIPIFRGDREKLVSGWLAQGEEVDGFIVTHLIVIKKNVKYLNAKGGSFSFFDRKFQNANSRIEKIPLKTKVDVSGAFSGVFMVKVFIMGEWITIK